MFLRFGGLASLYKPVTVHIIPEARLGKVYCGFIPGKQENLEL